MSAPAAVPLLTNVLYETKGPIAYVTVNRPEVLNALDSDTWGDLERAFEEALEDPGVRGVILTGAGEKAFIAGADISELAQITPVEAQKSNRLGEGQVWSAGSHPGSSPRRRWDAAPAPAGWEGPGAPAHPLGRDHQCPGSLPHRPGQRSRSPRGADPPRRGYPQAHSGQRPDRHPPFARGS